MAFKKTLVQRLFNLSRFSTPTTTSRPKPPLPDPARMPDPGDSSARAKRTIQQRRPLHRSAMHSPATPAGVRLFPSHEKLSERLRGMDISRDRIRLDGLIPFPSSTRLHAPSMEAHAPSTEAREGEGLTASEVRKVLRAAQVEMIRQKLREIPKEWITYPEFVEVCKEGCGGNLEQGLGFAKTLDESGSVIVLGNAVFLRHHQEIKTLVAKAIQTLISPSLADPTDPRRAELEKLEEQKAEIDRKADGLVRRELWAGLGYMVLQTAAFMRLTFWELSWDVMEPICFYVTSFYFMLGYGFFLRTNIEPSFEGFFQSRFQAKKRKLIKAKKFDIDRYNELRKIFHPDYSSASSPLPKMMFVNQHKSY